MAGEINGTTVVIQKGATPADIVGQMEATMTFGGTPIDISNKSAGDWIQLLDGEISSQQITFAGSIVYNDDTVFQTVRLDAIAGTQDDYSITFPNGEAFAGKFVPTGLADTLPHGDKVTSAINFMSSGAVTRTPPTL